MITPVAIKPFVCGYTDQGTVYIDYDLNKTHLYVFEVQCDENGEWTFDFEDLLYFDNEVERYIGLFKAITTIIKEIFKQFKVDKLTLSEVDKLAFNPLSYIDFKCFRLPTTESLEGFVKWFMNIKFNDFWYPLVVSRGCNKTTISPNISHYINLKSYLSKMIVELPIETITKSNLNMSEIIYNHMSLKQGDDYDTLCSLFNDIMWHLVLLIAYDNLD